MGNRPSGSQPTPQQQQQPSAPPPLLSAAVVGDIDKFQSLWNEEDAKTLTDSQQNNVLHALFSCRKQDSCQQIYKLIEESSLTASDKQDLLKARNTLGCTPLWILIAYGNVGLMQHIKDEHNLFMEMVMIPNHQGDSPMLATCSQGNTDMVRFLQQNLPSTKFNKLVFLSSNTNGTTPLQIVVANGHLELLEYLLEQLLLLAELSSSPSSAIHPKEILLQKNSAGLSLFHIASERDFHNGLHALLKGYIAVHKDNDNNNDDKLNASLCEEVLSLLDKNEANALHVAAYCGNLESVRIWVDALGGDENTDLLDRPDGQCRSPYWLAMLQGNEEIGVMLANAGVDTQNPKMLKEIDERKSKKQNDQMKSNFWIGATVFESCMQRSDK